MFNKQKGLKTKRVKNKIPILYAIMREKLLKKIKKLSMKC